MARSASIVLQSVCYETCIFSTKRQQESVEVIHLQQSIARFIKASEQQMDVITVVVEESKIVGQTITQVLLGQGTRSTRVKHLKGINYVKV